MKIEKRHASEKAGQTVRLSKSVGCGCNKWFWLTLLVRCVFLPYFAGRLEPKMTAAVNMVCSSLFPAK